MPSNFPFSAVVGQPQYKLALLLAAVNPTIGGVLVSGPRGSAKSTLARGLLDVLPSEQRQFVNLPLGATEEMLIGTLNLQQVMQDQSVAFQAGLLAKAHRGVLYVDEVNLLPDNLVDLLLDVAASGVNYVERDGVSHSHAANFLLLGTMNPDEGELRPQLLDRFGLAVDLQASYQTAERIAIVEARQAFDADAQSFCHSYSAQQLKIVDAIKAAQEILPNVELPRSVRHNIAERCEAANVDGMRADICWAKAATAHAALNGREAVTADDINAVEPLVLSHRQKPERNQPDSTSHSTSRSDRNADTSNQPDSADKPFRRPPRAPTTADSSQSGAEGDWGMMAPVQQATAELSTFETLTTAMLDQRQVWQKQTGPATLLQPTANSTGHTAAAQGKTAKAVFANKVDWFATLASHAGQWPLRSLRLRREKMAGSVLNLIMLDTSASTLGGRGFSRAKAAVLLIAEQAYLQRQQISVLGFGNQQVETLMPVVKAPRQLQAWLDNIPAAGGTPLAAVLVAAATLQERLLKKHPQLVFANYLITDGRTTARCDNFILHGKTMVIDSEQAAVKRGKGRDIARALAADYCLLPA